MTPTQISKAMIKCAENYFPIAEAKGANVIEVVADSKVFLYDNVFRFKLNKFLRGIEGIEIKINSYEIDADLYRDYNKKIIKDSLYEIVEYDDEKNTLIVSFDESILPIINKIPANIISFVCDLSFLIKNVITWYENYGNTLKRPKANTIPSEAIYFSGKESKEQKNAVETALSSKVSYVWGPPGTGKTQVVLADCVITYVKRKMPVLLLAPTNNALEQMLRALIKAMQENGMDYDCISRLGFPTKSFANQYPKCCKTINKLKLIKEHKNKIEKLNSKLVLFDVYQELCDNCSQFEQAVDAVSDVIDEHWAIQKRLGELQLEYSSTKTVLDAAVENEKNSKARYILLKNKAGQLQSTCEQLERKEKTLSHRLKKLFASMEKSSDLKIKLAEMQPEVSAAETEYAKGIANTQKLREELRNKEQEIPALRKKNQEMQSLLSKNVQVKDDLERQILKTAMEFSKTPVSDVSDVEVLLKSFSKEYTPEEREPLEKEIAVLNEKLEALSKQDEKTLVTACTIDYLYSHYDSLKSNSKCHVFLDEAAYVPLVKAGALFSLRVPVTMLGDHMQLPPICVADEKDLEDMQNHLFLWSQSALYFSDLLSENCKVSDVFEKYMCKSAPSPYAVKTTFLPVTYRFGDNLAKILNKCVYNNKFSGQKSFDTEIVVLDADGKTDNYTAMSEVWAIKKYISRTKPEDCAVLAPYRKQHALLKKELKISKDNVLTIHTSQGREWDNVIISVTDTRPFGFTNTKNPTGKCVLNTAISRAKKNIIVACNAEKWKSFSDSQLVGMLVESATKTIVIK